MRDTTQLHPVLQLKLLEVLILCQEAGLKIKITDCLRTVEEQDALYAQGRTKPGNIVTNARGNTYSSMHMWGVAADFCRSDGRNPYDNADGLFDKVGNIAKRCGLEWGGDWKKPVDKPHLQLPDWGSTPTTLKQMYGSPDKFFATWQPLQLGEKYKMTKSSYLRKTPALEGDANKVKYMMLSSKLQAKCRKDRKGFAVFKRGKSFNKVKELSYGGNIFAELQSGYYLPIKTKTGNRAKKV